MFKKVITCVLVTIVAGMLFAAETEAPKVDTNVLDSAYVESYINDKSPIEWKYYSSGKQIRDMGRRLGAEIKYQAEVNKTDFPYASGSPDFRYRAARVFPGTKQGADVIFINKNAHINNIKNVRRVVSGYIERAYGVTMEQADEIAKKVCYWNTNHYDDKAYFKENFQVRVREVFSNKTNIIGLARSYKNWPGKARIVIPFVLIKETVPEAEEPKAPVQEVEAPAPETQETPEPAAPVVEPEEQGTTKTGMSPVAIVLLALLGIAIIVLIISLVVLGKKKKNNQQ